MTGLQEHDMTWTRADAILEQSQNPNTKFFALQVGGAVQLYKL
jgi:exportin-1